MGFIITAGVTYVFCGLFPNTTPNWAATGCSRIIGGSKDVIKYQMGYGEIMVGHGSQGQHKSRRIWGVMSNHGGHEGVLGVIEGRGSSSYFC